MNPSSLRPQQSYSRSRPRRVRRNCTAEPLQIPIVHYHENSHERPQQTGVLWEPSSHHPPRPRRAPATTVAQTQSQQEKEKLQPEPLSAAARKPPIEIFSPQDAEAVIEIRKARITQYLSTWDDTWATASTQPDVPDITALTISESLEHGPTVNKLKNLVSPEDSEGGVAIPLKQEGGGGRRPATAELKAKIPWLVEQATINGAGWKPVEEYYSPEGDKRLCEGEVGSFR